MLEERSRQEEWILYETVICLFGAGGVILIGERSRCSRAITESFVIAIGPFLASCTHSGPILISDYSNEANNARFGQI